MEYVIELHFVYNVTFSGDVQYQISSLEQLSEALIDMPKCQDDVWSAMQGTDAQ